ncbi:SPFH domain-containing protein [uncultured Sphingomonas sp.]|uniref:slipin family protein n=1 Tax=uncultured Sphingomonas sp. TaxID=158754 RepID=UPI0035CBA302
MIRKEVIVPDGQRGLLIRDGRLAGILDPGRHLLWDWGQRLRVELVVATGNFASPWASTIAHVRPDIADEYFAVARPRDGQVAVVRIEGRAAHVVRPGNLALVWKVMNDVVVETFDVLDRPRLTKAELVAFEEAVVVGTGAVISIVSVPIAHVGLAYFDDELADTLAPGRYGYWQVGRRVTAKTYDTRPVPIEVTAQEILTRDRIALRVTLTSFVQVIDAAKLSMSIPDHATHVYKLVQFAIREAIGGRTLDEVLNDRQAVDDQIIGHVRGALGDVGLAVIDLGIKDVILPGEMRELINKVVEAEKVAQANLIRRREEVAATRSLLNTAKLIEDNPTLLRLKEMETLERVTEKIGRIDVHVSSGEGLDAILDRLVSLEPRQ